MTTELTLKKYNQEPKKMKVSTVNGVSSLRLYKLVEKGNDPQYQQKGLCFYCKANKATHNLNTYCERCWFYMQNQFNDRMFQV